MAKYRHYGGLGLCIADHINRSLEINKMPAASLLSRALITSTRMSALAENSSSYAVFTPSILCVLCVCMTELPKPVLVEDGECSNHSSDERNSRERRTSQAKLRLVILDDRRVVEYAVRPLDGFAGSTMGLEESRP